MKTLRKARLLLPLALLAGCASLPSGPRVAVMPTPGKPFEIGLILIGTFISAVLGDNVGYWFGTKTGPRIFSREDFALSEVGDEATRAFACVSVRARRVRHRAANAQL